LYKEIEVCASVLKETMGQQIFMKRWTMRSHLSMWRQFIIAAREARLQESMAQLALDRDSVLSESTLELQQLLAKTEHLPAKIVNLSTELEAAQAEARRLRGQNEILEKMTRNLKEEELMELKRRQSALLAQLSVKSAESSQQTVKLVNMRAENERVASSIRELEEQLAVAREDGEERELYISELHTQTLPVLRAERAEQDIAIMAMKAQLEGARELQSHSEMQAAAREEAISQALAAAKEARASQLISEAKVRQLNLELLDAHTNVERLEATEMSLREAVQNLKDSVAQLRQADIASNEQCAERILRQEEDARRMSAQREGVKIAAVQKDLLADFEERSKDLESVMELGKVELSRQRALRKEAETNYNALMLQQVETDKAYKAREAAAVKALSEQLQKLKDNTRKHLDDVCTNYERKLNEANAQELETRMADQQCRAELRKLHDECKTQQTQLATSESEADRLHAELRLVQEREKNLESQVKVLRREKSGIEEQLDAAENAVARADELAVKLRQVDCELKGKVQELEKEAENTRTSLSHELAVQKQQSVQLRKHVLECEKNLKGLSSELDATKLELEKTDGELDTLRHCKKELSATRLNLRQAEALLQELTPLKEGAEQELSKLRANERDAHEQVRLLNRQLEDKDKALHQHSSSIELLEGELQSLRSREKALSEELSILRRDAQRCRAAESSAEFSLSQQASKTLECEKKISELHAALLQNENALLQTEKECHNTTLQYDKSRALEARVESLRWKLCHYAYNRIRGERLVRLAVGLPLRPMTIRSSESISSSEIKSASSNGAARVISVACSIAGIDDELKQDEALCRELQWVVKRRVFVGWQEQSSRRGAQLVHAICVKGWWYTIHNIKSNIKSQKSLPLLPVQF
jgi:chromosome segregation ATPase